MTPSDFKARFLALQPDYPPELSIPPTRHLPPKPRDCGNGNMFQFLLFIPVCAEPCAGRELLAMVQTRRMVFGGGGG